MKKTIKEAMKHVNFLQQQISSLLQEESNTNYIIYSNENDKETSDFDFENLNADIEVLNKEILNIRSIINKKNQEVKVGIEDYTISDALIRIAQLTALSERFEHLGSYKQKTRQTTYNGSIEYTEYLYDVKKAQSLHLETVEKIHALQPAVDKANILTEIEL